jgi:prepilin-type N-terminal cleavage/methylation domain-containing protein
MKRLMTRTTSPGTHGFTMVESLICIVIVGVMLTAALRAVGASNSAQLKSSNRAVGGILAQSLADEIMAELFENPTSPVFGPEPGETTRASFNDVDDFNSWSESPPRNLDGTAMSNLSGWTRSVAIAWAPATDLTMTSTSDTGIKRIIVTVKRNNAIVATRTAIRTRAP